MILQQSAVYTDEDDGIWLQERNGQSGTARDLQNRINAALTAVRAQRGTNHPREMHPENPAPPRGGRRARISVRGLVTRLWTARAVVPGPRFRPRLPAELRWRRSVCACVSRLLRSSRGPVISRAPLPRIAALRSAKKERVDRLMSFWACTPVS